MTTTRLLRPEEIPEASRILALSLEDDPRNLVLYGNKRAKIQAKAYEFMTTLYFPFVLGYVLKKGALWGVFQRGSDGKEKMRGTACWMTPENAKKPPLKKLSALITKTAIKYPGPAVKFGRAEVKFSLSITNMCQRAGRDDWMLMFVGVDEAARGLGLGTALVDAVLCDPKLGATTFCTNERNVAFFERLGFTAERILTPQFDGVKCKTWLFVRDTVAGGERRFSLHSEVGSSRSLTTGMWLIPFEDLEVGKQLASGNFGVVAKGLYRGNDCVIKQLHDKSEDARKELLHEAAVMAQVRPHASVCAFFGVVAEDTKEAPLCVVTEWIAGGNLLEYVRERGRVLSERDILQLSRDLASGLQHIHSFDLIHADVAARNCLVVSTNPTRLRICDFGLSRAVNSEEDDTELKIVPCNGASFPVRWSPPETWMAQELSKRIDVWAFGVTIWEVLAGGRVPYDDLKTNTDVVKFVTTGGRLELPGLAGARKELFGILKRCWATEAVARPRFQQVVQELSALMGSLGEENSQQGSKEEIDGAGPVLSRTTSPSKDRDKDITGEGLDYISHFEAVEALDGGYVPDGSEPDIDHTYGVAINTAIESEYARAPAPDTYGVVVKADPKELSAEIYHNKGVNCTSHENLLADSGTLLSNPDRVESDYSSTSAVGSFYARTPIRGQSLLVDVDDSADGPAMIKALSIRELSEHLRKEGVSDQTCEKLVEARVDGAVLRELTPEHLAEMKVGEGEDRKRILKIGKTLPATSRNLQQN